MHSLHWNLSAPVGELCKVQCHHSGPTYLPKAPGIWQRSNLPQQISMLRMPFMPSPSSPEKICTARSLRKAAAHLLVQSEVTLADDLTKKLQNTPQEIISISHTWRQFWFFILHVPFIFSISILPKNWCKMISVRQHHWDISESPKKQQHFHLKPPTSCHIQRRVSTNIWDFQRIRPTGLRNKEASTAWTWWPMAAVKWLFYRWETEEPRRRVQSS